MSRITVLDPTAPPPEVNADPGPDVESLNDVVVGFRYDLTWRSFQWVMEEWSSALGEAGARIHTWCVGDGRRGGAAGERVFTELDSFATRVDAAVVGLGN